MLQLSETIMNMEVIQIEKGTQFQLSSHTLPCSTFISPHWRAQVPGEPVPRRQPSLLPLLIN